LIDGPGVLFARYPTAAPNVLTRLKNSSIKELDLVPEGEATSSHDPLEMHFRTMTTFRLLTREDEHSLARRLEKADLQITRALLCSPEGRAALLDVARAIRDRETRVEDVERNPADELPARIESVVERAAAFVTRTRTRARPPA
jgi:hypothetical protein